MNLLPKRRYIDGKPINQSDWLGMWIIYEENNDDNDPCPYIEIVQSDWRIMIGYYKNRIFFQFLSKFWPYRIPTKF